MGEEQRMVSQGGGRQEGRNGGELRSFARADALRHRQRMREETEREEEWEMGECSGLQIDAGEGRGADTRRACGSSSLPWWGEVASSGRTEGHAVRALYCSCDTNFQYHLKRTIETPFSSHHIS